MVPVEMGAVDMGVVDLGMPAKCIGRADIIVFALTKSTIAPCLTTKPASARFSDDAYCALVASQYVFVDARQVELPCDQFAQDVSSRTGKLRISRQTPAILL